MKTAIEQKKCRKRTGSRKPPSTPKPPARDNASTIRSDRRKAKLTYAANLNGFGGWSEMMTYIQNAALKGVVTVTKYNS